MKVLVTGAAGCLGSELIQKIIQDKSKQVFATDIRPNPFQVADNLEYQQFDLRSLDFFDWVREVQPQVIIHLASILQISAKMPRDEAYKIDVIATEQLLKLSTEINVAKFIVTTSGAGYGYHKKNLNAWIDEDWPADGNQDYFYSSHKAAVEQLMAQYRKDHPQLKQVVFRPGTIIGPNFDGPIMSLFQQKVITAVLGYPGPFNFIWSEDVVDYLIEAAESEITGQFNLAGDGAMSMKEIALKLNKPFLPLPAWLIKGALSILKPLGLIQYGPEQVKFVMFRPVLDNKRVKQSFKHQPRYTTVEALQTYLNHTQELAK